MSEKLNPLFVVKPKTMTRADIRRVEKHCGITVVECSEPDAVRYLEAPPTSSQDEVSAAALSLLRFMMNSGHVEFKRGDITKFIVDMLLKGKQPTPNIPPVQQVKRQ